MKRWPPKPGFDRHDEHHVAVVRAPRPASRGRRRVERDAGRGAGLADLREHAVQVHAGLLVHDDHVGAGGREVVDVALGVLDHEVHVEQRAGPVHERRDAP